MVLTRDFPHKKEDAEGEGQHTRVRALLNLNLSDADREKHLAIIYDDYEMDLFKFVWLFSSLFTY